MPYKQIVISNFNIWDYKHLVDRYLVHVQGRRIELPQTFWMRVAMGLAMEETNKEDRAIEFYNFFLVLIMFLPRQPYLIQALTAHNYHLAS